jgi:hypothetical protein
VQQNRNRPGFASDLKLMSGSGLRAFVRGADFFIVASCCILLHPSQLRQLVEMLAADRNFSELFGNRRDPHGKAVGLGGTRNPQGLQKARASIFPGGVARFDHESATPGVAMREFAR